MISRYFPKGLVAFVAKTGFITKATWKDYFFPGGSVRWKNSLWISLADRGYFVRHTNRHLSEVYILNRMNREVIEFLQGRGVRAPFVSQIDHDEVLVRGILPAIRSGLIVNWTTEAELKSFEQGTFRIESQGQAIKYPDAILGIGKSERPKKIALEIEITQKHRRRYMQIMSAYSSMKGIDGIVFVVGTDAIRNVIASTLKEVYFPLEKMFVGFIELKDWQADPLKSSVQLRGSVIQFQDLDKYPSVKRAS